MRDERRAERTAAAALIFHDYGAEPRLDPVRPGPTASKPPPGGNGMIRRTGRSG
jgi:hypothetical protein